METSETITKNQNKKESTKEPSNDLKADIRMFAIAYREHIEKGAYAKQILLRILKEAERQQISLMFVGDLMRNALGSIAGLKPSDITKALPEVIRREYKKNKTEDASTTYLPEANISHNNQIEQEEVKIKDNTTANLTDNEEEGLKIRDPMDFKNITKHDWKPPIQEKEKETEYNMAEITRPFTAGSPQPQHIDNATIGSVSEHKALIDQVNELTKQNNELSAENQNLKSIVIEKNKTIDRLNDTVQKLDTQIQYLKDQNKNMEKVDVNVVRADNNKPQPTTKPKSEVKQQQQQQTTEQDNDGEFDQEKEKARLEKLLEAKETEFLSYKGAKVGRIALSSDIRDLKDRISMLSRKK